MRARVPLQDGQGGAKRAGVNLRRCVSIRVHVCVGVCVHVSV